ncbi:MAG: RNA 2',3'-cyclic phosphodiesterase [Marmoricola sp.]
MRMFVAMTPSTRAIDHLEGFLEPRRETASFRWTVPEQWHLTLAFAAHVPERKLDELVERLGRAAAKRTPTTAAVAGGGAFPNVGRAKVIWAGLDIADPTEMQRLATGCRAAMSKAGAEVDGQRFRAHLTLARTGQPVEATSWVRLLGSYRGPEWPVAEVALVASYLGEGPRNRARHQVVETFRLGRR